MSTGYGNEMHAGAPRVGIGAGHAGFDDNDCLGIYFSCNLRIHLDQPFGKGMSKCSI